MQTWNLVKQMHVKEHTRVPGGGGSLPYLKVKGIFSGIDLLLWHFPIHLGPFLCPPLSAEKSVRLLDFFESSILQNIRSDWVHFFSLCTQN